jgi:hypothetical protein
MRTFEEISTIIENLEDTLFERLNGNDFDAFMGDRNAQARFRRALKKAGLTKEEWQLWAWAD